MSRRTLGDIGADLEALDALLEELEGDVTGAEDTVTVWFAELGADRDEKLDRYARYIADLEAGAAAKKAEENRLHARRQTEERRAKWLKGRLFEFLSRTPGRRIDTGIHKFGIVRNGGRPGLDLLVPPEELPAAYRREQTTVSPDQDAIRAALDAGEELPFVRLRDVGERLTIR